MTGREILWHLFRLALAAVCLWLDTRLFLFYAFTIVLMVSHQIDRLRAAVRILSLGHDTKLLALADVLKVSEEDIGRRFERIRATWSPQVAEGIDRDLRRASGEPFV